MSWLSDRSHAALSGLGIVTPPALTGLDPTTHPLSQEEMAAAAKAAVAYAVDPSGLTSAQIVAAQVAKSRAETAAKNAARDLAAAAGSAQHAAADTVVLDPGQTLQSIGSGPVPVSASASPLVILGALVALVLLAK